MSQILIWRSSMSILRNTFFFYHLSMYYKEQCVGCHMWSILCSLLKTVICIFFFFPRRIVIFYSTFDISQLRFLTRIGIIDSNLYVQPYLQQDNQKNNGFQHHNMHDSHPYRNRRYNKLIFFLYHNNEDHQPI